MNIQKENFINSYEKLEGHQLNFDKVCLELILRLEYLQNRFEHTILLKNIYLAVQSLSCMQDL